jgi:cell division protein ZapE
MSFLTQYRRAVADGTLKPDPAQEKAAAKLQTLSAAMKSYRPGRTLFGGLREAPRGLYLWGGVGRGKSMLMDLFFEATPARTKRRIHFNAFMVETHARIHAERESGRHADPIAPVAKLIAEEALLLCFDEFQVTDVADAMILGRLFEQLFERGTVIVATSNTSPDRLYEGGLNRQLFLPFIATIESKLEILELNGGVDYRRLMMSELNAYLTPLGPETDAAMDRTWRRLTGQAGGSPMTLTVLGRALHVSCASKGVARFTFEALCTQPLAAADYLAIAYEFHTVMIDRIPKMTGTMRDAARRFVVLIDTLYDERVKLICSAEVRAENLYVEGDGAEAFQRTVSRLIEMQSQEYLDRAR